MQLEANGFVVDDAHPLPTKVLNVTKTPKSFEGVMPNAQTTVYTVPAATIARNFYIAVTASPTGGKKAQIFFTKSGGTARLIASASLATDGDTLERTIPVMAPGDKIDVLCNAAAAQVYVATVEEEA